MAKKSDDMHAFSGFLISGEFLGFCENNYYTNDTGGMIQE
jgi:hypothetical protein